jgi:hypothetical protein
MSSPQDGQEPPFFDKPTSLHNECLNTALLALELGYSPLVPREDGTKAPAADLQVTLPDGSTKWTWKPYETTPATADHIRNVWFGKPRGSVGLVTGYGDLECFEFEDALTHKEFLEAAWSLDLHDLVARIRQGYEETTPGGGFHWLYRCSERRGNTKLAYRHKTTEEFDESDLKEIEAAKLHGREHKPLKLLIETRGEGAGFIIIAPSNGKVHRTGGAYVLRSGGLPSIISITPEERDLLWNLARTFDAIPEPFKQENRDSTRKPKSTGKYPGTGKSPGADFEEQISWSDILEPFGWQISHKRGEVIYWTRPGKDKGVSATTGFCKGLKVFSTSTPFDTKGTHSKLHVYVVLNHKGDYKAATRALAENGYGTWIDNDGQEKQNPPPEDWKAGKGAFGQNTKSAAVEQTEAIEAFVCDEISRKCTLVSEAPESTRIAVVYESAYTLGRFLPSVRREKAAEWRGEIMERLFLVVGPAVQQVDGGADEIRKRIASSVSTGEKQPLSPQAVRAAMASAAPNSSSNEAPADGKAQEKAGKQTREPSSYGERGNCLFCGRAKLANFTARITTVVIRDEAEKLETRYEITATHESGKVQKTIVPAEKYDTMKWPYSLGGEFVMGAQRGVKDMVREGIQILSAADGIERRDEHTATGWIKHNGRWLYLHGAGAIGAKGHTNEVDVDLSHTLLRRYNLPTHQATDDELRAAMAAHLDIWALTYAGRPGGTEAAAITATLPWRAVLGFFNVSIHFGGPTGNKKTAMARLNLQHFAALKGRDSPMPADWHGTDNGLQRALFDSRDSLLVVDDLKSDRDLRTAEIIFQSQGNGQGRVRMNADQSMKTALSPSGSLLSTGEIDPRTQSACARVLACEFKTGDIDLEVLTRLQAAGDAGHYRVLMAAYIQWLSTRLDEVRAELVRMTAEIRENLGEIQGAHARFPDVIANLVGGYRNFMDFAVDRGLITAGNAQITVESARVFLRDMGADQAEIQEQSKAGRRFLDLLASAMTAGRCHVVSSKNADEPPDKLNAHACGWRCRTITKWEEDEDGNKHPVSDDEYFLPPGSKCIGVVDEDPLHPYVYLDPDEAVTIAAELARSQSNPQSFASIGRELLNERLVKPHKEGKKIRPKQYKCVHGNRRRVYWVKRKNFIDPAVPTDPTATASEEESGYSPNQG